MQQRHHRRPAIREHADERAGCEDLRRKPGRPFHARVVPGWAPARELGSDHQPRRGIAEDERSIGELLRSHVVKAPRSIGVDALDVEL